MKTIDDIMVQPVVNAASTMESIQDGREAPHPFSRQERLLRLLWKASQTVFVRCAPYPSSAVHRMLLRVFGARIGNGTVLSRTVSVEFPWLLEIDELCVVGPRVRLYNLGSISIGKHTVISQGAHLCAGTHDYEDVRMPLLRTPISVGKGVWLCAECFVGPSVHIGDHAVVGARSVITKDVPVGAVVAGSPARQVKQRTFHRTK